MKTLKPTQAWIILCLIALTRATEHSDHNVAPHHDASSPKNYHKPTGLQIPDQVLDTTDVSCVSADTNIFEIMSKAKQHCKGNDMKTTFYLFNHHKYYNIGTLDLNKELFNKLLTKYDNWLLTDEKIDAQDGGPYHLRKIGKNNEGDDKTNVKVKDKHHKNHINRDKIGDDINSEDGNEKTDANDEVYQNNVNDINLQEQREPFDSLNFNDDNKDEISTINQINTDINLIENPEELDANLKFQDDDSKQNTILTDQSNNSMYNNDNIYDSNINIDSIEKSEELNDSLKFYEDIEDNTLITNQSNNDVDNSNNNSLIEKSDDINNTQQQQEDNENILTDNEKNDSFINLKPTFNDKEGYFEVFLPKDENLGEPRTINAEINIDDNKENAAPKKLVPTTIETKESPPNDNQIVNNYMNQENIISEPPSDEKTDKMTIFNIANVERDFDNQIDSNELNQPNILNELLSDDKRTDNTNISIDKDDANSYIANVEIKSDSQIDINDIIQPTTSDKMKNDDQTPNTNIAINEDQSDFNIADFERNFDNQIAANDINQPTTSGGMSNDEQSSNSNGPNTEVKNEFNNFGGNFDNQLDINNINQLYIPYELPNAEITPKLVTNENKDNLNTEETVQNMQSPSVTNSIIYLNDNRKLIPEDTTGDIKNINQGSKNHVAPNNSMNSDTFYIESDKDNDNDLKNPTAIIPGTVDLNLPSNVNEEILLDTQTRKNDDNTFETQQLANLNPENTDTELKVNPLQFDNNNNRRNYEIYQEETKIDANVYNQPIESNIYNDGNFDNTQDFTIQDNNVFPTDIPINEPVYQVETPIQDNNLLYSLSTITSPDKVSEYPGLQPNLIYSPAQQDLSLSSLNLPSELTSPSLGDALSKPTGLDSSAVFGTVPKILNIGSNNLLSSESLPPSMTPRKPQTDKAPYNLDYTSLPSCLQVEEPRSPCVDNFLPSPLVKESIFPSKLLLPAQSDVCQIAPPIQKSSSIFKYPSEDSSSNSDYTTLVPQSNIHSQANIAFIDTPYNTESIENPLLKKVTPYPSLPSNLLGPGLTETSPITITPIAPLNPDQNNSPYFLNSKLTGPGLGTSPKESLRPITKTDSNSLPTCLLPTNPYYLPYYFQATSPFSFLSSKTSVPSLPCSESILSSRKNPVPSVFRPNILSNSSPCYNQPYNQLPSSLLPISKQNYQNPVSSYLTPYYMNLQPSMNRHFSITQPCKDNNIKISSYNKLPCTDTPSRLSLDNNMSCINQEKGVPTIQYKIFPNSELPNKNLNLPTKKILLDNSLNGPDIFSTTNNVLDCSLKDLSLITPDIDINNLSFDHKEFLSLLKQKPLSTNLVGPSIKCLDNSLPHPPANIVGPSIKDLDTSLPKLPNTIVGPSIKDLDNSFPKPSKSFIFPCIKDFGTSLPPLKSNLVGSSIKYLDNYLPQLPANIVGPSIKDFDTSLPNFSTNFICPSIKDFDNSLPSLPTNIVGSSIKDLDNSLPKLSTNICPSINYIDTSLPSLSNIIVGPTNQDLDTSLIGPSLSQTNINIPENYFVCNPTKSFLDTTSINSTETYYSTQVLGPPQIVVDYNTPSISEKELQINSLPPQIEEFLKPEYTKPVNDISELETNLIRPNLSNIPSLNNEIFINDVRPIKSNKISLESALTGPALDYPFMIENTYSNAPTSSLKQRENTAFNQLDSSLIGPEISKPTISPKENINYSNEELPSQSNIFKPFDSFLIHSNIGLDNSQKMLDSNNILHGPREYVFNLPREYFNVQSKPINVVLDNSVIGTGTSTPSSNTLVNKNVVLKSDLSKVTSLNPSLTGPNLDLKDTPLGFNSIEETSPVYYLEDVVNEEIQNKSPSTLLPSSLDNRVHANLNLNPMYQETNFNKYIPVQFDKPTELPERNYIPSVQDQFPTNRENYIKKSSTLSQYSSKTNEYLPSHLLGNDLNLNTNVIGTGNPLIPIDSSRRSFYTQTTSPTSVLAPEIPSPDNLLPDSSSLQTLPSLPRIYSSPSISPISTNKITSLDNIALDSPILPSSLIPNSPKICDSPSMIPITINMSPETQEYPILSSKDYLPSDLLPLDENTPKTWMPDKASSLPVSSLPIYTRPILPKRFSPSHTTPQYNLSPISNNYPLQINPQSLKSMISSSNSDSLSPSPTRPSSDFILPSSLRLPSSLKPPGLSEKQPWFRPRFNLPPKPLSKLSYPSLNINVQTFIPQFTMPTTAKLPTDFTTGYTSPLQSIKSQLTPVPKNIPLQVPKPSSPTYSPMTTTQSSTVGIEPTTLAEPAPISTAINPSSDLIPPCLLSPLKTLPSSLIHPGLSEKPITPQFLQSSFTPPCLSKPTFSLPCQLQPCSLRYLLNPPESLLRPLIPLGQALIPSSAEAVDSSSKNVLPSLPSTENVDFPSLPSTLEPPSILNSQLLECNTLPLDQAILNEDLRKYTPCPQIHDLSPFHVRPIFDWQALQSGPNENILSLSPDLNIDLTEGYVPAIPTTSSPLPSISDDKPNSQITIPDLNRPVTPPSPIWPTPLNSEVLGTVSMETSLYPSNTEPPICNSEFNPALVDKIMSLVDQNNYQPKEVSVSPFTPTSITNIPNSESILSEDIAYTSPSILFKPNSEVSIPLILSDVPNISNTCFSQSSPFSKPVASDLSPILTYTPTSPSTTDSIPQNEDTASMLPNLPLELQPYTNTPISTSTPNVQYNYQPYTYPALDAESSKQFPPYEYPKIYSPISVASQLLPPSLNDFMATSSHPIMTSNSPIFAPQMQKSSVLIPDFINYPTIPNSSPLNIESLQTPSINFVTPQKSFPSFEASSSPKYIRPTAPQILNIQNVFESKESGINIKSTVPCSPININSPLPLTPKVSYYRTPCPTPSGLAIPTSANPSPITSTAPTPFLSPMIQTPCPSPSVFASPTSLFSSETTLPYSKPSSSYTVPINSPLSTSDCIPSSFVPTKFSLTVFYPRPITPTASNKLSPSYYNSCLKTPSTDIRPCSLTLTNKLSQSLNKPQFSTNIVPDSFSSYQLVATSSTPVQITPSLSPVINQPCSSNYSPVTTYTSPITPTFTTPMTKQQPTKFAKPISSPYPPISPAYSSPISPVPTTPSTAIPIKSYQKPGVSCNPPKYPTSQSRPLSLPRPTSIDFPRYMPSVTSPNTSETPISLVTSPVSPQTSFALPCSMLSSPFLKPLSPTSPVSVNPTSQYPSIPKFMQPPSPISTITDSRVSPCNISPADEKPYSLSSLPSSVLTSEFKTPVISPQINYSPPISSPIDSNKLTDTIPSQLSTTSTYSTIPSKYDIRIPNASIIPNSYPPIMVYIPENLIVPLTEFKSKPLLSSSIVKPSVTPCSTSNITPSTPSFTIPKGIPSYFSTPNNQAPISSNNFTPEQSLPAIQSLKPQYTPSSSVTLPPLQDFNYRPLPINTAPVSRQYSPVLTGYTAPNNFNTSPVTPTTTVSPSSNYIPSVKTDFISPQSSLPRQYSPIPTTGYNTPNNFNIPPITLSSAVSPSTSYIPPTKTDYLSPQYTATVQYESPSPTTSKLSSISSVFSSIPLPSSSFMPTSNETPLYPDIRKPTEKTSCYNKPLEYLKSSTPLSKPQYNVSPPQQIATGLYPSQTIPNIPYNEKSNLLLSPVSGQYLPSLASYPTVPLDTNVSPSTLFNKPNIPQNISPTLPISSSPNYPLPSQFICNIPASPISSSPLVINSLIPEFKTTSSLPSNLISASLLKPLNNIPILNTLSTSPSPSLINSFPTTEFKSTQKMPFNPISAVKPTDNMPLLNTLQPNTFESNSSPVTLTSPLFSSPLIKPLTSLVLPSKSPPLEPQASPMNSQYVFQPASVRPWSQSQTSPINPFLVTQTPVPVLDQQVPTKNIPLSSTSTTPLLKSPQKNAPITQLNYSTLPRFYPSNIQPLDSTDFKNICPSLQVSKSPEIQQPTLLKSPFISQFKSSPYEQPTSSEIQSSPHEQQLSPIRPQSSSQSQSISKLSSPPAFSFLPSTNKEFPPPTIKQYTPISYNLPNSSITPTLQSLIQSSPTESSSLPLKTSFNLPKPSTFTDTPQSLTSILNNNYLNPQLLPTLYSVLPNQLSSYIPYDKLELPPTLPMNSNFIDTDSPIETSPIINQDTSYSNPLGITLPTSANNRPLYYNQLNFIPSVFNSPILSIPSLQPQSSFAYPSQTLSPNFSSELPNESQSVENTDSSPFVPKISQQDTLPSDTKIPISEMSIPIRSFLDRLTPVTPNLNIAPLILPPFINPLRIEKNLNLVPSISPQRMQESPLFPKPSELMIEKDSTQTVPIEQTPTEITNIACESKTLTIETPFEDEPLTQAPTHSAVNFEPNTQYEGTYFNDNEYQIEIRPCTLQSENLVLGEPNINIYQDKPMVQDTNNINAIYKTTQQPDSIKISGVPNNTPQGVNNDNFDTNNYITTTTEFNNIPSYNNPTEIHVENISDIFSHVCQDYPPMPEQYPEFLPKENLPLIPKEYNSQIPNTAAKFNAIISPCEQNLLKTPTASPGIKADTPSFGTPSNTPYRTPYNSLGEIKYSGYKTYLMPSLNSPVMNQNVGSSWIRYSPASVSILASKPLNICQEPYSPYFPRPDSTFTPNLSIEIPLQAKLSVNPMQQDPNFNNNICIEENAYLPNEAIETPLQVKLNVNSLQQEPNFNNNICIEENAYLSNAQIKTSLQENWNLNSIPQDSNFNNPDKGTVNLNTYSPNLPLLQATLNLNPIPQDPNFKNNLTIQEAASINYINIENSLKTNLINYINNNNNIKAELFNNNNDITIPIGDFAITNKEAANAELLDINNPSIGLKMWKSNAKLLKAELKFKFKEFSVNNFMPIVNKLDDFDLEEIKNIVKNYINEKYGHHFEVYEPYNGNNRYTVINDFNFNNVSNHFNLLWPADYVS